MAGPCQATGKWFRDKGFDGEERTLVFLQWTVLAALVLAGYLRASLWLVPLAALVLMADSVFGKVWRLRRHANAPLTVKGTTYLALGAIGWLCAAWGLYVAGSLAGTALRGG